METTVHEPEHVTGGSKPPLSSGGNRSDSRLRVEDSSPASRTGVWVVLAAISMTFAALTSSMVIRRASSYDWQHFTLPPILYFDTAVLLTSSLTLELARKRIRAFLHRSQAQRSSGIPSLWLTLVLGLVFLGGQYTAWLQLRSEGLHLATNPSTSFFYLFTALHALHILGGLAGLTLVLWPLSKPRPILKVSTLSTVSYYWHFMDLLWVYLLLLLWSRM
jgi:cytochrome c oxidase subunit III